jgi:hypothetical protein
LGAVVNSVVDGVLTTVVAVARVVGGAALGAGRIVVAVRRAVVVVLRVLDVDWAVEDVEEDVDVLGDKVGPGSTATTVASASGFSAAAASWESRMAGSLWRVGTPAMATPMAAHSTSMAAVIERWPGFTAPTVRAGVTPQGDPDGTAS